jgi:sugar-specific transcriptional regulator TrmB
LKELNSKLQEIGLSKREAELYLALLTKNEFTAPELSKITSVTRTKTYEFLQNLVRKNLCNVSTINNKKVFKIVEPKVAIDNLLHVYEEELLRKKSLAKSISNQLMNTFNSKKKIDDPLDYIQIITDVNQVRSKWFEIQKKAKKELLGFTKKPYAVSLEENIEIESNVLSNKVSVKGIYEIKGTESKEDKDNLKRMLQRYQKMGEQVRLIEELPMKLVISDEKTSIFMLDDRVSLKGTLTTMIIVHPSFALALKKVFESYWAASITLDEFS